MGTYYNPRIVTDGLVLDYDAANPKSYSNNVMPYSQDLLSWFSGTNGACTISRDTTIVPSPARGIPMKMQITGDDPYVATYNLAQYNLAPASIGQTWVVSVWVKASVNTTGEIFIFGDTNAGNQVFTTVLDYAVGAINITTEWTRVSFAHTFTKAEVQQIQSRLDGPNSGGTGISIWWDGLQVERAPSPTPYNPMRNVNGQSCFDISGKAYNGTLYNSLGFSSNNSGTFVLNGTNNFILAPSVNALGKLPNHAFEIWFKSPGLGVGQSVGGLICPDYAMVSYVLNGQIYYYLYNTDNTPGYLMQLSTTGVNCFDNNWHHVVCTRNESNASIYVDSVLRASTSGGGTWSGATTWSDMNISIGRNPNDGIYNLLGNIGLAKIYNKYLTAQEVKQNFNATRGRYGI
jgi:hypothetical protein